jgi:hypothetical protein
VFQKIYHYILATEIKKTRKLNPHLYDLRLTLTGDQYLKMGLKLTRFMTHPASNQCFKGLIHFCVLFYHAPNIGQLPWRLQNTRRERQREGAEKSDTPPLQRAHEALSMLEELWLSWLPRDPLLPPRGRLPKSRCAAPPRG